MKILIICSKSSSLINFRGQLLQGWVEKGYEVVALGPDYQKDVHEKLSEWGVDYRTYFMERAGINILNDIKGYYSLKKHISKIHPDLVFSYTIKPVIYGSLAAKSVGVSYIYALITGLGSAFENFENIKSRLLSNITARLYKVALKKNDGILFQNPDDMDVFIGKKLVKPEKVHRVYGSGVDLKYYYETEPIVNPIRFIFIGRLLWEKGILDFIDAAMQVREEGAENIEFHVVGDIDANPSSVTAQQVEKWVNRGIVKFHGWVKDVRPLIEKSSVFVLPSYREGLPRTALECMAMAKPLIMTDVPGCRETVVDNVNGYLVPLKNSKAIANKMSIFINNPELIKTMGKESRRLVEEIYDVEKVNQHIMKILAL